MMSFTTFLKNFVFQAYSLENLKLVASERRSSNIVPEMVLFQEIYIKINIFSVSGQLPPRKIAPRLGLGFGSRPGLLLELGGNHTIALKENFPR